MEKKEAKTFEERWLQAHPDAPDDEMTAIQKKFATAKRAPDKDRDKYGSIQKGLDEKGTPVFFRLHKETGVPKFVEGVAPEPKAGIKVYDPVSGNLILDTTGGKDKTDLPLKLTDLTRLRHPKTGKPPSLGMTEKQAKEAGYEPISQSVEKQDVKLRSAQAVVGRIEELAKKIWGTTKGGKNVPGVIDVEGGFDRITQAPGLYLEKTMQQPDVAIFEDAKKGFASLMMKALGEERVTDQDVERGIQLFPKLFPLPDRREVVERKLKMLYDLFDEIARRTPEQTNISKMSDEELLKKIKGK